MDASSVPLTMDLDCFEMPLDLTSIYLREMLFQVHKFVDMENAFDSVPRTVLWEVLWEYRYRPFDSYTTIVRAWSA